MAYVGDLLSFQVDSEVTRVFAAIRAKVLLRPTVELLVGQTIAFLGRELTHEGERIEVTLGRKRITKVLEEQNRAVGRSQYNGGHTRTQTSAMRPRN